MEVYATKKVEEFSWILHEGGVSVCITEEVREETRRKDELEFVRWKEECYGIIQIWHSTILQSKHVGKNNRQVTKCYAKC